VGSSTLPLSSCSAVVNGDAVLAAIVVRTEKSLVVVIVVLAGPVRQGEKELVGGRPVPLVGNGEVPCGVACVLSLPSASPLPSKGGSVEVRCPVVAGMVDGAAYGVVSASPPPPLPPSPLLSLPGVLANDTALGRGVVSRAAVGLRLWLAVGVTGRWSSPLPLPSSRRVWRKHTTQPRCPTMPLLLPPLLLLLMPSLPLSH
jgi:hypothetical protein